MMDKCDDTGHKWPYIIPRHNEVCLCGMKRSVTKKVCDGVDDKTGLTMYHLELAEVDAQLPPSQKPGRRRNEQRQI